MRNVVLALAASAALSACATGSGTAIQRISTDLASSARVTEVALVGAPKNVSDEFAGVFKAKVAEKLSACATGARALRVEADITSFHRANPAMTWLIADANQIKGSVKLVDAASGEVVGTYSISRAFGGSGLIGIALMSQADEQMSQGFGEEVCKAVFKSKAAAKPAKIASAR